MIHLVVVRVRAMYSKCAFIVERPEALHSPVLRTMADSGRLDRSLAAVLGWSFGLTIKNLRYIVGRGLDDDVLAGRSDNSVFVCWTSDVDPMS